MKKVLFPLFIVSISLIYAQTPCNNGMAGSYPCHGYDLQSFLSLDDMDATRGNDSWGWTDPDDGKEYAIMGLNNGTAFIDVSDPINPIYLGKLPSYTSSSTWRDIKVYSNHAFIVSEANGHGMQIFDLTHLRSVTNPPETFTEDAHYSGFSGSHNIVINEESGFAYSVGDNTYSGGAHFIDISNPIDPVAAGGYSGDGYTHDAQVVIYNGPDSDYIGQELFIGSNEDKIVIVDVTDKNNPQNISTVSYSNYSYTHQGWFTEDHRYFIVGDESDEINFGFNTRTIIIDLSDLDNPSYFFDYSGATLATDHNGYVKGDKFYLANNAAGLRVLDISDIANGNISEEGFFDSHPQNNNAGYEGIWSLYPYFESGNIVMSDREGFFLIREPLLSVADISKTDFVIFPNPANESITINSQNLMVTNIEIHDVSGKLIVKEMNLSSETLNLDISSFSKGVYLVQINNQIIKKFVKY